MPDHLPTTLPGPRTAHGWHGDSAVGLRAAVYDIQPLMSAILVPREKDSTAYLRRCSADIIEQTITASSGGWLS